MYRLLVLGAVILWAMLITDHRSPFIPIADCAAPGGPACYQVRKPLFVAPADQRGRAKVRT